MKYRISRGGYLQREVRPNKWRPMLCPFTPRESNLCGDRCPLFTQSEDSTNGYIVLSLCNAKRIEITVQDWSDERE